jgi:hypothetical protein
MTVLPFLRPPQVVIVYLQAPRERYWGMVRAIDATGIVIQGGELGGFDTWMRQVAEGAPNALPSTMFFPLNRVEKVLVDSPTGDAPSLAQQFERRLGRSLAALLET